MFAEEPSPQRYRAISEVESRGLEPLPSTPISPDAEGRLLAWGLQSSDVLVLRELCATFRYDGVAEKINRLAQTPVFIRKINGIECADLPHMFDISGRLDGQCGDIARSLVVQAHFSGFLTDLNEAIGSTNTKVVMGIQSGLSKTHFIRDGSNHVWNSLSLVDFEGNVRSSIQIDAAFQTIQTPTESGYLEMRSIPNPSVIKEAALQAVVRTGAVQFSASEVYFNPVNTVFLGCSQDRKYIYSLSFSRSVPPAETLIQEPGTDQSQYPVLPVLARMDAKGLYNYFVINPETGLLSTNHKVESFPPEELTEILKLLEEAQAFTFSTDMSQYPRPENYSQTIELK